jgi:cyanophycin synthetase
VLQAVGVPVPEGRAVADAEDAWDAAQDIGLPVVVKPQDGNQGRGVATDLRTRAQVLAAYDHARAEGSTVLVERFAPGADYRLLVVGDRVVAAARREPAQVVGDGRGPSPRWSRRSTATRGAPRGTRRPSARSPWTRSPWPCWPSRA